MTGRARSAENEPAATEKEVLDLLERHYARPGNGGSGEYAFLRQVRNAAGFDATRTFDAVVVGLWPSRGHDVHVIEVKVSKGDWKRELAKPQKAEDAAKVADRFSIAAPRGVVDLAEVPATWGYIELSGGVERFEEAQPLSPGDRTDRRLRIVEGRRVRVVRAAPLLRPAEECRGPIPRGLLVAMLRSAGAVPDVVSPEQAIIDKAVREAETALREKHRAEVDREKQGWLRHRDDLNLIGNTLHLHWSNEEQLRAHLATIKTALDATRNPRHAAQMLDRIRDELIRTVSQLERYAGELRGSEEIADSNV